MVGKAVSSSSATGDFVSFGWKVTESDLETLEGSILRITPGKEERQILLQSSLRTLPGDPYVNEYVGPCGRHGSEAVCRHIPSLQQALIVNRAVKVCFSSHSRTGLRKLRRLNVFENMLLRNIFWST
jgi:hypothetical protein